MKNTIKGKRGKKGKGYLGKGDRLLLALGKREKGTGYF
jgi:hypothetical protein